MLKLVGIAVYAKPFRYSIRLTHPQARPQEPNSENGENHVLQWSIVATCMCQLWIASVETHGQYPSLVKYCPVVCFYTASLAAKNTIFDCLVEDHILFFQPFLHLLNVAYQEFGKRATRGKGSQRASQPIRQTSMDEELVRSWGWYSMDTEIIITCFMGWALSITYVYAHKIYLVKYSILVVFMGCSKEFTKQNGTLAPYIDHCLFASKAFLYWKIVHDCFLVVL